MKKLILKTITLTSLIFILASVRIAQATALPAAGPHPKPTIVLVHGAFADSSSWNGVVRLLLARGYPVVAVANPLRGLQSDSDYVSNVLKSIQGGIVVVGHSYGGSVISVACVGNPNVKALVFVAGVAPN